MVIDPGHDLDLGGVGEERAGGHIELPQFHRDGAFPAAVILASPAPGLRLDQPVADQRPVYRGAGYSAMTAAFHLEHQPPRTPLRMCPPLLAAIGGSVSTASKVSSSSARIDSAWSISRSASRVRPLIVSQPVRLAGLVHLVLPGRLAAFKGNTQLKAGHLPQARGRSVILGDLAAVEAAQHNPEAACAHAIQALDQLARQWYATGMDRVLEVRKALQPDAGLDCVQALDDRLYDWQATLSTLQR
jgi:hypothetical protein